MSRSAVTRRAAPLAVLVLALGVLGACGGDDDDAGDGGGDTPTTAAEAGAVRVVDNEFEPGTVTVSPGDTVTWTFEGQQPHNVTGESFESETMEEGEFEHTFDDAGTFEYTCTIHPGMDGTVEVR